MSHVPPDSDLSDEQCSICSDHQQTNITFSCDTCSVLICKHCEEFYVFQCEACNLQLCECRLFVREASYPLVCEKCYTLGTKDLRTKSMINHTPCVGSECNEKEDCTKKKTWRVIYTNTKSHSLLFMKADKWRNQSQKEKLDWNEERVCGECYDVATAIIIPNDLPKPNFMTKKSNLFTTTPPMAPMNRRKFVDGQGTMTPIILFPKD